MIQECVAGVVEFNAVGGNFENIDKTKLLGQLKRVDEELRECIQALQDNEGNTQVLKEGVDLGVTVMGYLEMLEQLRFDVCGAWQAVNENNLSKYPKHFKDASLTKKMYEAQGIHVDISHNEQYNCYVIKDENGKVRKPHNYQNINVASFAKDALLEG